MNIAVLVKASLDTNMLRVDSSGRLLIEDTPLAISEYDRNAVEEAVKIKEAHGGKVVAFSLLTWGPIARKEKDAENVLREALAMGADEAHLVSDESLLPGEVGITALVLAKLLDEHGPFDIVLTGEASMDMLSSQLPARIAEKIGASVITYVRKIEVADGVVRATRDLEDSLETIESKTPVVISVTGEINQPRLPTLLQIRRSFAKPLNKYKLSDLGIPSVVRKLDMAEVKLVTVSRKNIVLEGDKLEDIAEKLIEKLMEEGVVKG
jgi:electron transfer flavoprotein beta subunit